MFRRGDTLTNPAYHAVIHATYSITPTVLNEIGYNQNGNVINIVPTGIVARPSGLTFRSCFPGNNLKRIPGIQLGGSTGTLMMSILVAVAQQGGRLPGPRRSLHGQRLSSDQDGRKLGSLQQRSGPIRRYPRLLQIRRSFTGNDFADFLIGYAKNYTELAVQDHGTWNNVSPAVYIQDNWHVNKRLSINLGLRWDGIPHTYEVNNRMSNFYPQLYNPANAADLSGGQREQCDIPG